MNEPFQPGYFSPDTPDGMLVQHALEGNQEAFAALVGRYHTVLVRYISSWSPDLSLVPDIEQDTLLRLYLSLSILRTDQPLRAWLLRVAYYACMSECRRRKSRLFSPFEHVSAEEESSRLATLPDPDPLPEELLERLERHHLVQRAIEALPRGQRAAIRLKYLEQLSYRDIARRLHIPEGTAKTNVARAKPMLRHLLTGEICFQ